MKDQTALKTLTVVNIFLVGILTFVFVYSLTRKQQINESPSEVIGAEQLIQETKEEKKFSVSICDAEKKSCVWLSSEELVEDGIANENAIYQSVLDSVIPHLEKYYGGKTMAQSSKGGFIYWKEDMIPDLSNIFKDVYNGFKSGKDTQILIQTKDLPATDGRYSNKYIEIDNSKQKLYVWIDGKVEKEILLSGPKVGYEVYGVFPIVDKGISPIAPTGRYMPYWMAFYYSKRQDSWYGLHALIWWYDENGKKVYEPTTNIGVRRSGGCIRMLYEDSKYLYEIFEKGDHILIHE